MTKNLEKKLAVILSFLMVLLTIFASFLIFESRQKKANEALKMQLHQLQLKYSPMQRDTIRDSVKLVTQQVMVMDRGEYKLLAADRKLLEELNLKLRQVVSDQRVSMVTSDTVKTNRLNSVYSYSDAWLSLRLDTADSILTYRARDSLQCIVAREYKHKFLWWRWGTKGYNVKVLNFNPHSTILYNSFIQVSK
uniref:DUF6549 family protein n=1 Tax=Prevotella sp. TaxID=59823 RepID=UPI003FEFAD5E